MLIEIWERLRGYDKWIQTEATIRSSELAEVEVVESTRGQDASVDEWHSIDELAWTGQDSRQYTGEYEVSENSPLFQLYDGQTVTVRYNPDRPGEFYLRGVLRSKVISTIKWKIIPALFVICILGLQLLRLFLGSPAHPRP
jgi:hypothetical protein